MLCVGTLPTNGEAMTRDELKSMCQKLAKQYVHGMTEDVCTAIMAHLMEALDSDRSGVFLEIGCGSFAYSFENIARLGYQCVAVEPLPPPQLLNAAKNANVFLIQGIVSEMTGESVIYRGLHGDDLSTTEPTWFGAGKTEVPVKSFTLADSLNGMNPTAIKMDVEGCELSIIKQIPGLSSKPSVVMFEFGGGLTRSHAVGGWSPEYLGRTMECLRILRNDGYLWGVMSEYQLPSKMLDLSESDPTPEMFSPNAIYGNIVLARIK